MKQKLLSSFNLRAILAFFFLSYIPISFSQYCNSAFTNVTYEFITNVTFAGIANTSTGNTGGPVNYTAQVANVSAGSSYNLSVTIDPDANDYVVAYFDWNQDGDLNDANEIYTVVSNTSAAGPHTVSVAVPPIALAGNTRMRVVCQFNNTGTDPCVNQTYGEAEDYTVNVSTTLCAGTPAPGNTTSSSPTICPSTNFTLGLQNATVGTGVTYQWQSSPDGVTYTDIAGATNSTYTASQTAATYYMALVSCNGGTAVPSNPIQVTMSNFLDCYCGSAPMYIYDEDITNVTLGTLNNTSTCSTVAGTGSVLNQYSNFTGVAAPTLLRTATYGLSITIGSCSYAYNNMSKVYIDFNQNGSFTDPGEQVYVSPAIGTGAHTETAQITIPLGAVLGTTRMRVITNQTTNPNNITPCGNGSYFYGETEDYYVTIAPAPSCLQPTALVWLSGTTSSAELAWTPGATETSWVVEYGAPGFTPGTGTTVPVTGTPETTISGLPANTFYQYYVKAVCSPSDQSFNSGPFAFNTYGLGQYMEADAACGTGYISISGNSTATNLNLTDDSEVGITLPFPVYFQASLVSQVTVGNNGGIKFNTTTADVAYTMDAPGVYPFNQDFNTALAGGGVFMEVIGTAPNRKLVVEWKDVPHYIWSGSTDGSTFEFVFEEATSEFYFHYDDIIMSNPSWDNGADAEIGVRGAQNIDVSINSTTYLTNNECVHFYYTDCPKPKNLMFSNITNDEFSMDWATGLSNETEWIVEYGPAGFTPGSSQGTILTDILDSDQQISGLTPLTTYDVYIYAACANGDISMALTGSVQTLPLCSDPYALYATSTDADSIKTTWNWTETVLPIQGFNLQYGPTGFDLYGDDATIIPASGINFADTIDDVDLMAGVTYQVYVQAVCPAQSGTGTDTSNFVGPFSVTMPLTNDTVCYAEPLMTDGTVYTFTNNGATVANLVVSNLEQTIAPPNTGLQTTTGWGNSTISNSTWFTFVAPASGQVRISGKDVGYDGQMAVYKVGNCAQFSTFELEAANDNEIGGNSLAPNFTVCGLTPGSTYYLLHDPFGTSTGTYSIKISAINLQAGSTGSLVEICTGDSVSLFDGITGNDAGGVWSPIIPSIALVQDSVFASAGLAYQTFQFEYRMTDGCAYDSILANVKVFPPSHAGTDGSLVVCRNEPFNLLEGLGGNVDMGGTWYNPNSAVVPAGNTIADNFPGQYNYKYIVGNGVCPNDTAKVIVSVGTCNYLGLDETAFEGFNLYPNPTDGFVYVSNSGSTEVFNYEVLDLNGRKVMMKENAINGTAVTEIDLNSMETGIYMIHVFNGSAEKTFRVVVK